MTTTPVTTERDDLLDTLGKHRFFLRHTVRDLTDAQARSRPTVSALTLAGLVKHVADTEEGWARFAEGDPAGMAAGGEVDWSAGDPRFVLGPDDTLAALLDRYAEVAARTDELVRTLDLDATHPLPEAPWFAPGVSWSVRRVWLHVVAETSQHAGHADILRESVDGALSMG